VDLPTALLRDLLQLSASGGLGDNELEARLAAVMQAMCAAVPSYRGMDLTAYDGDQPVSLTAFLEPNDVTITTSLGLPFVILGSGFHRDSRGVFYAATLGAFVDLAADLGHALQAPVIFSRPGFNAADGANGDGSTRGDQDGQRSIVLDADLPPRTLASGLTGLVEMSTINRAVGMLIGQGYSPDEAQTMLRRHASAAGVEPHVYAARIPKD
jgi:hypothetical protein